jgi:hypothetical protein
LLAPLWLLLPTERRSSWGDRAMVACLCLAAVLITLSPCLLRIHRTLRVEKMSVGTMTLLIPFALAHSARARASS